jgi:putative membrane protein
MNLQKTAASAGLAACLTTAAWGLTATGSIPSAGASASTTSSAANAASAASSSTHPLSGQDRLFLDEASEINLAEISLGRYIHAHGTTRIARDLGASYAHDHTAAQVSLGRLASRLHVTLPTSPGAQLGSIASRVEGEAGRSKDTTFVKVSVTGHEAAIAAFKKEISAGSNPSVKAYAARYLPMLQTHLKLAEHAEKVLHVS